MRGSLLKNGLAVVLAALLLFGGTAKEALHAWTGHRDTVHTHRADGALVFDAKHHHCDFLGSFLLPFTTATEPAFTVQSLPPVYGEHAVAPLHLWETRSRCFIAGRGPPQVVVFA